MRSAAAALRRNEIDADGGVEGEGDAVGGAAAARASEQLWHSQRRTQADLLAANEVCLCCGLGGGRGWCFFFGRPFFKQNCFWNTQAALQGGEAVEALDDELVAQRLDFTRQVRDLLHKAAELAELQVCEGWVQISEF